jgi:hypothetical protein
MTFAHDVRVLGEELARERQRGDRAPVVHRKSAMPTPPFDEWTENLVFSQKNAHPEYAYLPVTVSFRSRERL